MTACSAQDEEWVAKAFSESVTDVERAAAFSTWSNAGLQRVVLMHD